MAPPWLAAERPRRTAAARRAQAARASARAAQQLLREFSALSHRGCSRTRIGAALEEALRRTGAPVAGECGEDHDGCDDVGQAILAEEKCAAPRLPEEKSSALMLSEEECVASDPVVKQSVHVEPGEDESTAAQPAAAPCGAHEAAEMFSVMSDFSQRVQDAEGQVQFLSSIAASALPADLNQVPHSDIATLLARFREEDTKTITAIGAARASSQNVSAAADPAFEHLQVRLKAVQRALVKARLTSRHWAEYCSE
ncbi:unnamed protein product [Prorocentrum cordatum]|uniref:Uncharacterized protein n=1 Tax=Prorocentrum cordatum TaxID=2364126 RepID=A0ABN9YBD9_9DINO|nr:unnamed protein product [Polarella glacialis]